MITMATTEQKIVGSRGNPARFREQVEALVADGWEVAHRTAVSATLVKKAAPKPKQAPASKGKKQEKPTENRS